ncbi:MAG: hypothetical protein E3K32_02470 [wastewater metagenome]|nr:hypothetical protein [Candidatus Loosdrechtia aerotolerans]
MQIAIKCKNTKCISDFKEKVLRTLAFICGLKERYKPFLKDCFVIYMGVKVGLILLATFSAMAFLLLSITPRLSLEMSLTKALLFTSPLMLIIMLKLYFICKIIVTYDESRLIVESIISRLSFKSRRCLQQIEESFLGDLSQLSPEKIKNRFSV